jgi:hypothetical protein
MALSYIIWCLSVDFLHSGLYALPLKPPGKCRTSGFRVPPQGVGSPDPQRSTSREMTVRHVIILIPALAGLFLATGCRSTRFVFLNVGKYDSIARRAIADAHPGVDPHKLDRRRFEFEDNRVWRYPDSTLVLNFKYYATNDTVTQILPDGITTTIPTYSVTLERDGSVRRMSHGSHTYSPPAKRVEPGVSYGAQGAPSGER